MQNGILFLLVCVKLLLLLCGCLGYRLKKKSMAAVVLLLFGFLCTCFWGEQCDGIVMMFMLLLTIPITILASEGKNRGIICVLGFFLISYVEDFISTGIKKIAHLMGKVPEEGGVLALTMLISLVLLGITSGVLQLLVYRKKEKVNSFLQNVNKSHIILLSVGMATCALLATPFTSLISGGNAETSKRLAVYSLVGCIAFFVISVLLMQNNQSKRYYMHLADMNQKMLELNEKYYQALLSKETETRKFRHDMSAHMVCLQGMLEENKVDDAKGYLNELSGSLTELKAKHQTGNLLVNAILNDIHGKYNEVCLAWDGRLPGKLQISDTDLCVIFSNLLENAFLAAALCAEGGSVKVTVDIIAGALKVIIQNDMEKPLKEKNGKFISQKEDKENHGFGVGNVKECVAENGGEIHFSYTRSSFTAKIILPNVV